MTVKFPSIDKKE